MVFLGKKTPLNRKTLLSKKARSSESRGRIPLNKKVPLNRRALLGKKVVF